MGRKTKFKKGPLIQLLEVGIEFWIRSQCNSIETVKLELNGSFLRLISGNISELRLIANEVNFQGFLLKHVDLTSDSLQIKVNLSNKYQKVYIKQSFNIDGIVYLDERCLNTILFSKSWSWVGDSLAKQLLDIEKLEKLEIKGDKIIFSGLEDRQGTISTGSYGIKASKGKLCIEDEDSLKHSLLPMDDSIQIKKAILKNNELEISISSTVNP